MPKRAVTGNEDLETGRKVGIGVFGEKDEVNVFKLAFGE